MCFGLFLLSGNNFFLIPNGSQVIYLPFRDLFVPPLTHHQICHVEHKLAVINPKVWKLYLLNKMRWTFNRQSQKHGALKKRCLVYKCLMSSCCRNISTNITPTSFSNITLKKNKVGTRLVEKKQYWAHSFLQEPILCYWKSYWKKYPINCERQKLHRGPNDLFFNQPTNMFMSAVHLDSLTHWWYCLLR